jgi:hypothetical protein
MSKSVNIFFSTGDLDQLTPNSIQRFIRFIFLPNIKDIGQKIKVTPVKVKKAINRNGDIDIDQNDPKQNLKEEDLPRHLCMNHERHQFKNKVCMSKNDI